MAQPVTAVTAPAETTNTTPSGPTISQDDAIAAYTTGLYAIDGMKDLVSDIRTGYADGQVELVVTPYFENQPKATREDLAQSLWRAWVISSESQQNTSRANIRLVNSRGDSVGGSGPLKGVYVDD